MFNLEKTGDIVKIKISKQNEFFFLKKTRAKKKAFYTFKKKVYEI
jgi:hypothetical protein